VLSKLHDNSNNMNTDNTSGMLQALLEVVFTILSDTICTAYSCCAELLTAVQHSTVTTPPKQTPSKGRQNLCVYQPT
jgi:hypothetical protein